MHLGASSHVAQARRADRSALRAPLDFVAGTFRAPLRDVAAITATGVSWAWM